MMTSKERVEKTFEFKPTDRIPTWCGASPEFLDIAKTSLDLNEEKVRQRFGDDFRQVQSRFEHPELKSSEKIVWKSPFGIERIGIGYGQPTSHPLQNATTSKEIGDYPWPDPAWADISHIKTDLAKYNGEYSILSGEWAPYWHDAIDLIGHEALYYKMYDHPNFVLEMMERITDYYYIVSKAMFDVAADDMDIFFIGNDFGSQNGPLLGVEMFEKFLLPSLKRLIDLGHQYNLKVMLHCCGGFEPLIPSMIAAGLDGLHALQPNCVGMKPEDLKNKYGKDIVLNGAIDSHNILINGTPELVREETSRILDIMSKGSGYIAGASHDYILPETPLENVLAMYEVILNYQIV